MTAAIHFSEFSTLAACERKWAYRYALGSEEEAGHAAHLGTLLHVGTASWLNRAGTELPASWDAPSHSNDAEPGAMVTYSLADFAPEVVAKARWLLARYTAYYGSEPPSSWNVISTEQWLTARTPWGTLAGTADALVEIEGQLYLIERKSYGSKGRLDWVQVDPQLGSYDILVEANFGRPCFGIIFDGIYTYQWVPKQRTLKDIIATYDGRRLSNDEAKVIQATEPGIERDPSESFQREWVDLSDDHRRTTSLYLRNAVSRKRALLGHYVLERTIPNIGRQCSYCDFKPRCWNDLGGVEPDEIEVDDGEEPV